MVLTGVMHPEQLAMMTRVLHDYCREHEISCGSAYQAKAASMILALYRHGYQTAEDLRVALDHEWVSKH